MLLLDKPDEDNVGKRALRVPSVIESEVRGEVSLENAATQLWPVPLIIVRTSYRLSFNTGERGHISAAAVFRTSKDLRSDRHLASGLHEPGARATCSIDAQET